MAIEFYTYIMKLSLNFMLTSWNEHLHFLLTSWNGDINIYAEFYADIMKRTSFYANIMKWISNLCWHHETNTEFICWYHKTDIKFYITKQTLNLYLCDETDITKRISDFILTSLASNFMLTSRNGHQILCWHHEMDITIYADIMKRILISNFMLISRNGHHGRNIEWKSNMLQKCEQCENYQ